VIRAPRQTVPLEGRCVLIVDDHRIFAEVIAQQLSAVAPLAELHLATRLAEARALARAINPDLVIVDYDLAGECGVDLLPDLVRLGVEADVIVVSASRDPDQILDAFERGAHAWVDKTGRVDDLLDAVAAAWAGDMYLSPVSVRRVIRRQFDVVQTAASANGFAADCTDRELEVLRHLMAGQTRPEVAAALGLSTNTVRTHVQSLLKTAGVHSTLALIAAAREAGVAPAESPARRVVNLT
jgi:DNA-binding NarL/FixJ family response regulator